MSVLDKYADSGFMEWLFQFFAVVPVGFLLGVLIGLLAFGIFGLFSLFKRM